MQYSFRTKINTSLGHCVSHVQTRCQLLWEPNITLYSFGLYTYFVFSVLLCILSVCFALCVLCPSVLLCVFCLCCFMCILSVSLYVYFVSVALCVFCRPVLHCVYFVHLYCFTYILSVSYFVCQYHLVCGLTICIALWVVFCIALCLFCFCTGHRFVYFVYLYHFVRIFPTNLYCFVFFLLLDFFVCLIFLKFKLLKKILCLSNAIKCCNSHC